MDCIKPEMNRDEQEDVYPCSSVVNKIYPPMRIPEIWVYAAGTARKR